MPRIYNPVLRSTPVWLACCLVCGSVLPVWAQDNAPTTPPELAAVTVTAKGHTAPTVDTPAAVLALDREDLFQLGARSVGEALRGQPGLAVASDGAQGQNPVIRGLKRESIVWTAYASMPRSLRAPSHPSCRWAWPSRWKWTRGQLRCSMAPARSAA